ncbi:hypothetical protein A2U01_0085145, partial [Trifolium medium]|nr:hypothetical protein [Trifolium medium]
MSSSSSIQIPDEFFCSEWNA